MGDLKLIESISSIMGDIGVVLIPVIILFFGEVFRRQRQNTEELERQRRDNAEELERQRRDKAEAAQRSADRVALLLRHLASDSPRERFLAVNLVKYLVEQDQFPPELRATLDVTYHNDRPDIAAAAQMAVQDKEELTHEVVLLGLLAPLKVNFDRSFEAFQQWRPWDKNAAGRHLFEEIVHNSNLFARDILVSNFHMIPSDLIQDAATLVTHYTVWLEKYYRIRPNGVRDLNAPPVFVGPDGFPFPRDAKDRFVARFEQYAAESSTAQHSKTATSAATPRDPES